MEARSTDITEAMSQTDAVEQCRKKARRHVTTSFTDEEKVAIRNLFSSSVEHFVAGDDDEDGDNDGIGDTLDTAEINSDVWNGMMATESAQYSVIRQRRVGPRHGRGGRKRGPPLRERRRSVTPEITKLFARTLIAVCGGSIGDVINAMKQSLTLRYPEYSWTTEVEGFSTELMMDLSTGTTKAMYEVLPAPYFAICIKLPYSQTGASSLCPMDRYSICTWLGDGGKPFCTCVGSTTFRIGLQVHMSGTPAAGTSSKDSLCLHAKGLFNLIEQVSLSLRHSVSSTANVVMDMYARRYNSPLATYIQTRPRLCLTHEGNVAVISEISTGSMRLIQFTPVRIIQKGSGGYICAFCDTVLKTGCYHTKIVRNLRKENDPGSEMNEDDEDNKDNDDDQLYSDEEDIPPASWDTPEEEHHSDETVDTVPDHKSFLPLSPVNCSRSLKVDRAVGGCVTRGEPYILTAPQVCSYCNAYRNPKSLRMREGILMCTLGPCLFQLELFNCSNERCGLPIETEGREHCVLIDKCTAATHVLLKRELLGVVMSNGTMNSRLRQYHSEVTSLVHAKIIPSSPPCRSVRTLHHLCTIMLKLMVAEPDKTLFLCSKCDEVDNDGPKRTTALCIDGINQGYLRRKQVTLQNLSQPCSSVPSSDAAFHGNSRRPLTTLIRRRETSSILLNVINDITITVTKNNVSDVAAAIRIVAPKAIPPQFCSASVCGRTSNDYYDDIGDNPILQAIRKVTTALFHADTILYGLIIPLDAFIKQCISDNSLDY